MSLFLILVMFFSASYTSDHKPDVYDEWCSIYFIGGSARANCKHMMENNRFFASNFMFCGNMRGNSQKRDCLMTVANKIFPHSALDRCIKPPFSAECLGGEYKLIPQRDENKIVILNCTDRSIKFGLKDHPDDSWKEISLSENEIFSKACVSESCNNNPVRAYVSTYRGNKEYHEYYQLPFGKYYSISFDVNYRLKFYNDQDNIMCMP